MSDNSDKKKDNSGGNKPVKRTFSQSEELKKHNREQQQHRESGAKHEKRGAGSGNRPKR